MGWTREGGYYVRGPSEDIWDAAPQFVKSELHKLGLERGVRTQLKQQYIASREFPRDFRVS